MRAHFARSVLTWLLLAATGAPAAFGQAVETRIGLGRIGDVAWNHDGSRYAIAHDHFVEVFDAVTHDLVLRLPAQRSLVASIDFSPSGDRIAVAGGETGRVFDATTGALLLSVPGWEWTADARFGGDGTLLFFGRAENRRDGPVALHDSRTGRRLVTFSGDRVAALVDFSSDGTRVLQGSWHHRVFLSDAATGAKIRVLAEGEWDRGALAISPDGKKALIGITPDEARIYDLDTGAILTTLAGRVGTATWSADGSRILTGSGSTVRLLDSATGVEIRRLTGLAGDVIRAEISPDGTKAITSSDEATGLRIWDLSTETQILGLAVERGDVYSRAWSLDGTQALSSGWSNARLRDVATGADLGEVVLPDGGEAGVAVAFLPDGPGFVSEDDGEVHLWDVASGAMIGTFAGHTDSVLGVAFSADGTRLATASRDETAILWNVASETAEQVFTGHASRVLQVAISLDGALLATAAQDETIRIWDVATGSTIRVIDARGYPQDLTFSPDGGALAAGVEGRVKLWSVASGKRLRAFDNGAWVLHLCFSPDGSLLACGGEDFPTASPFQSTYVTIFDADTGKRIETAEGLPGRVAGIQFSADGERLFAGGATGSALIWDWGNDAPTVTKGPRSAAGAISTGEVIPLSVRVEDDEGDPIDVVWSFGDGTTATGLDVTHEWTERGVVHVCVTAGDGATRVTSTREVSVGRPKQMVPRVKIRLDFARMANDRLDLRLKAPFDMPMGILPTPTLLEVDVVSVRDETELWIATALELDDEGRAQVDGMEARVRQVSGSDLWRLDLALRNQDFETEGVPAEDGDWNFGKRTDVVPVTIRVRIDGKTVWTTSADFRYTPNWRKKGKLRK